MAAELELHAGLTQLDIVLRLDRGPQIRQDDVRASRREQFRRRDSAARGPHHHDALTIH
jgi:hypothetical protein